MAGSTCAIGDVHGDLEALHRLLERLPPLDADDTMVFVGDYVDRGPKSKQVLTFLREQLPHQTKAKLVLLRGNHEDAWLRVAERGWPEFVLPASNGCLACLRSYRPAEGPADAPASADEMRRMLDASFFPRGHLEWMSRLAWWHEDEHAVYVHGGLVRDDDGRWLHPRDTPDPKRTLWTRSPEFFADYRGKTVVCGHTATKTLPQELSSYTPQDPLDMWAGPAVFALDTGSGHRGFLSALMLPERTVFESR